MTKEVNNKKKCISLVLSLSLLFSVSCVPTFAAESSSITSTHTIALDQIADSSNVYISDAMTFTEMVNYFANKNNISYEKALTHFPNTAQSRSVSATYRTLSVGLTVTSEYHPSIDFYCETSETSNYWGIVSIYSVHLNRGYNGISRQFSGTLEFWLRSAYQIEYIINGDFYYNGTTTVSGGEGVNVGIDKLCTVNYQASNSYEANHYKYFYEGRTVAFQS